MTKDELDIIEENAGRIASGLVCFPSAVRKDIVFEAWGMAVDIHKLRERHEHPLPDDVLKHVPKAEPVHLTYANVQGEIYTYCGVKARKDSMLSTLKVTSTTCDQCLCVLNSLNTEARENKAGGVVHLTYEDDDGVETFCGLTSKKTSFVSVLHENQSTCEQCLQVSIRDND